MDSWLEHKRHPESAVKEVKSELVRGELFGDTYETPEQIERSLSRRSAFVRDQVKEEREHDRLSLYNRNVQSEMDRLKFERKMQELDLKERELDMKEKSLSYRERLLSQDRLLDRQAEMQHYEPPRTHFVDIDHKLTINTFSG